MKNKELKIKLTVFQIQELDDEQKNLLNYATKAMEQAYAPYSNFKVGCAIRLSCGNIITGNNQEKAAYPSGLCAERVGLFYAKSQYPDSKVKELAVIASNKDGILEDPITPCGACRQVITEIEDQDGEKMKLWLFGKTKGYLIESASDLLPLSFGHDAL